MCLFHLIWCVDQTLQELVCILIMAFKMLFSLSYISEIGNKEKLRACKDGFCRGKVSPVCTRWIDSSPRGSLHMTKMRSFYPKLIPFFQKLVCICCLFREEFSALTGYGFCEKQLLHVNCEELLCRCMWARELKYWHNNCEK